MLSSKILQHFDKKVIWITGASSGIGRALAIMLSQADCDLYISARSGQGLQETARQCVKPESVVILDADLTSRESNQQICKHIKERSGRLDIAILNAGTCEYVDVEHFDSAIFERLIQTNYMSMVYGIEATLPLLQLSRHAQLVGMSSTAAYLGLPRSEAYGSTKAAILNMLRALKVSLSHKNIDVSVICPGFVKTELTDQNDFSMPCLITADSASQYILKGIARSQHEIHFPKRFSYSMKLISILPDTIQFHLLSKLTDKS